MELSVLQAKADLSEGEWIENIPNAGDLRLKVRSINYKPFKIANAGLGRGAGKKLNNDEGLVEYTVTLGKPIAEHIVTDWENLPITNKGKPLPYSKENAIAVFTLNDDHGVGDELRGFANWAAQRVADKKREQTADAEGN